MVKASFRRNNVLFVVHAKIKFRYKIIFQLTRMNCRSLMGVRVVVVKAIRVFTLNAYAELIKTVGIVIW